MTNNYPDYETYKKLYLRYVNGRDGGELLQLLRPFRGEGLLDLCCGEGWLTIEALEVGAGWAVAVDAEPAMISPALEEWGEVLTKSVHRALRYLKARGDLFGRIVCRQAVNYWLDEESAKLAAALLTDRGVFAFNTFNRKPSEKPHVKQYELEGHAFTEISWLIGDMVHHLQVREGMAPHHTVFKWLPPERIREILEPYFEVVAEVRERTSLYRCVKK